MNHLTWSKKKFWSVLVGVWVFGVIMAGAGSDPRVEPVVREVDVVKEVPSPDTDRLEQLDAIDRAIFAASAEVVEAQSTALEVAAGILGQYPVVQVHELTAATETITQQTAIIEAANAKVHAKHQERQAL